MNSNYDWKTDPRLSHMNKEKLNYIVNFSEQLKNTGKDQLLQAFMAMQMDAGKKGIQFNDQETEILVSVLTANMSPAEKKRMDALRMLAQKLAARTS